jgi:NDP-sugar pyrophosphorylase family protein
MQCVILAAGRGVRMGDLTKDTPKPMLRVNGRPILEYTLSNLPEEILEVVFVIGYKGNFIKSHFGDEWKGKKIKYALQEDLKGSGDALHRVLNGDDLYHFSDLKKFITVEPPAILVKEVDGPGRFGAIKTDEKGHISEIIEGVEENCGSLVNTGAYLLDKNFFDYELAKKSAKVHEKEFGLPQTMMKMNKDYRIKAQKADFWHPLGYPEDIIDAEKIISDFSRKLAE